MLFWYCWNKHPFINQLDTSVWLHIYGLMLQICCHHWQAMVNNLGDDFIPNQTYKKKNTAISHKEKVFAVFQIHWDVKLCTFRRMAAWNLQCLSVVFRLAVWSSFLYLWGEWGDASRVTASVGHLFFGIRKEMVYFRYACISSLFPLRWDN